MRISLLIVFLTLALQLSGQTGVSTRLALVTRSDEAFPAADILTAKLSSDTNLQLLERDQIEKIYREQGLSTANTDYLNLGHMLSADGLLVIELVKTSQDTHLLMRLIAVNSGVVLLDEAFPWPLKDLDGWSTVFANHLNPLIPKLKVLSKDAIPISVVNLRSAISSDEAVETERQLKLLTIQRLSREPQFFVLERQQMQLLSREKDLQLDDSGFWNGRYLLDGEVDQQAYSKATITINARLRPSKGGAPLEFEVSGPRTNLAEVIDHLSAKVDELLAVKPTVKEWSTIDEAREYFAEAKWAMRWAIYPEAQMAADSAWALGDQDSDTATLRVRAYSQIVPLGSPVEAPPPENMLRTEIIVLAIPDGSQFEPLTRAMDLFCQDACYVLGPTNEMRPEGFIVGLQLLRRAAGLLESYYYAAEMRYSKADQLTDLREKMRVMLATMDAYPLPGADDLLGWRSPKANYRWLKWEEGGICYEQPEDALPLLHQLLENAYHPEHLPRLVGWSWANRKRVPGLMQQFIESICADTNPTVQLEGQYLGLLWAPNDENGSLEASEQKLLSSMWGNRQFLFRSAGNVSLLERTENALRSKYNERDPAAYYDREPFAGFKHRLRMDFLANTTQTDPAVFEMLFPNTSVKMETPAQARELLPLALSYQERIHSPAALNWPIDHLRDVAGATAAVSTSNLPQRSSVRPQSVLVAKFIKWNLRKPGIDPNLMPRYSGMMLRNGKLWVRVRYFATNGLPVEFQSDFPTTYLCVDPQKGVEQEIRFPDRLGVTGDGFEVSTDSLFASARGHLYRFTFETETWEEIPAPVEGSSQLIYLEGNLYVSRSDGLLKVNPASKEVQVILSSRHQPALSELDQLWTPSTLIFLRSDGRLGALSQDHCFCFDPGSSKWNIRALPVLGTNNYFNFWCSFVSGGGAQQFLTGAVAHRYLVGYWNDKLAPESLLMESSPFKTQDPATEQLLQPVRWNWPPAYPLEPSTILAEDNKLWILCPRKVWQSTFSLYDDEPVTFSDDRQATLFCFEAARHTPLAAAIRFEDNGAINPKINGRTLEMLHPMSGGFLGNREKLANHVGNAVFWLKTPEGLVYGTPAGCGHWFISDASLQVYFRSQQFPSAAASVITSSISKP